MRPWLEQFITHPQKRLRHHLRYRQELYLRLDIVFSAVHSCHPALWFAHTAMLGSRNSYEKSALYTLRELSV